MNAEDGQHRFTLTAPAASASLTVIRGIIEAVSKLVELDQQGRYEVVLAVHEACSNIIDHTDAQRRSEDMLLECVVSDAGLEIKLRDNGPPFDIDAVPEFDPTELRRGGRGVFMIRRFMDEVDCTALPEGGNELRMFRQAGPRPSGGTGQSAGPPIRRLGQ